MHHFAVAISDRATPPVPYADALTDYVSNALVFKPDRVTATAVSGADIASFQVNLAAYGIADWTDVAAEDAILIMGLPTFENFSSEIQSIARTRPAGAVRALLENSTLSDLYARLGGVYAVVHVGNGQIRAISTFCGYGSLMFYRNDGILVVGNKLPLILSFLSAADRRPNYGAASWLVSTTMILGNETPFAGIQKVLPGYGFEGTPNDARCQAQDPRFYLPPKVDTPTGRRRIVDNIIARYAYYLDLPITWRAHITGGKDSRAVIAAIMASGRKDRIDQYVTMGSPENGDVLVAELISSRLDLPNHRVVAGSKAASITEDKLDAVFERFAYTAWRYDGQLTSWDGAGGAAAAKPEFVTFMGGGGEIYRQKGIFFPVDDRQKCVERLRNWYYKFNDIDLLSEEYIEYQERRIEEFIDFELARGVRNLQPALYTDLRMNNWGAGHYQNSASPSVASLVDLECARLAQCDDDAEDRIHYEIIDRCCPELLTIPLTNQTWDVKPAGDQSVLTTPIRKNFPWQYAFAERRLDRLVSEILDGASVLGGMLKTSSVEELARSPERLQNSARLKMLFGARNLIALYSGESAGKPDFAADSFRPECSGTYAPQVREILDRVFPA